ncbi:DUF3168 domain-containing protein [Sulfitobacter sp. SK012]|uniref:DUF3168 domain-containing protein n=1 Tax=Sulfitobacter sp. SK012 TaxID=1389005 RepID=UPI000E0B0986|nr:DUF3168 domain-containing protein [Sulfitobacter sp. SK012]AXI47041.1 DUF3168 domain-containing protein [Sulfitobacter sp. SK012]
MSYAMASALQTAVFGALASDVALAGLVGTAIYDAVPSGALPEIYVRLGSETVTDASDATGAGAVHRFTVSVITANPGFASAKLAAAAVSDVLHNADLALNRGRLVSLRFDRATASRIDTASARQIDLRFRARVQDD